MEEEVDENVDGLEEEVDEKVDAVSHAGEFLIFFLSAWNVK